MGSALVRRLRVEGNEPIVRRRDELDLLNQAAVHRFFRDEHIDYAFIAAARVGGIYANATQQADFLYENLVIAANTIHAVLEARAEKSLYLGSSCVYPRLGAATDSRIGAAQRPLETTNEGYAISKIAGLKMCEMYHRQYSRRFISAMPTNLYGPGDNLDLEHSHVIPGMMRRFHEAKGSRSPHVTLWGTGAPLREFLHVDDLAEALCILMNVYEDAQTINIGTGE